MQFDIALLIVAITCSNLMLIVERKRRRAYLLRRLLKAAVSVCYVTAFIYWTDTYTLLSALMLLGALFATAGDQYMVRIKAKGHLMLALWFFVCQHLLYLGAISSFVKIDALLIWSILAVASFAGAVLWFMYGFLKPSFRLIVPIYASALAFNMVVNISAGSQIHNFYLIIGITLFAISDLFVAANRFISEHWMNRVVGNNLYGIAQFLLLYGAAVQIAHHQAVGLPA